MEAQAGKAAAALQALRQATSTRHAAIERQLQLDGDHAPWSRYAATLQVFEAMLREWEPRAAQALPPALRDWFEAHRRGPLATRDLQQLGLPPLELQQLHLPPVDSPAAALGSTYVIEGSALGGLVIARRLAQRFGITAANGGAFFAARQGAGSWRQFCSLLEPQLADPAARAEACAAACLCFDRLAEAFARQLATPAAG